MINQESAHDEITLAELWQIAAGRKWTIIIVTLLTAIAAVGASFLMTSVYRGETLLAPRDGSGFDAAQLGSQFGGLASLAGVSLDAGGEEQIRAVAMLRSRVFAEQFIRENDLMPILFHDVWDEERKKWIVDDPEDVPTMRQAVRKFIKEVRSVSEDPNTGLVTLTMEWSDPRLVKEWTNAFVDRLNQELRQRAIAEAQESITYLENEAKKTSIVELRQAIYGLIEEQIQAIMLANVREDFAFEVLDPAVEPGTDERIWPKPVLMLAIGFLLGLFASTLFAFMRA